MTKSPEAACPLNLGERWLCEEHPLQPWEHEGCGGAGLACVCNPKAEVIWRKILVTHEKPDSAQ